MFQVCIIIFTQFFFFSMDVKFFNGWSEPLFFPPVLQRGAVRSNMVEQGAQSMKAVPRKVPVPQIDQKSFLSNKIQNALRKKLKECIKI